MAWVLNDPPPKFGAELAECQRHQINLVNLPDTNWQILGTGHATNATIAQIFVPLPVTMRATSATVKIEGNIKLQKFGDGDGNTFTPIDSVTVDGIAANGAFLTVKASGLTPGSGYNLWATYATQFIIDQNL